MLLLEYLFLFFCCSVVLTQLFSTVINMHNARKKKLVSRRHDRRIIANNTDIDNAGCEHISSTDSFNLDIHDDTPAVDICNSLGIKTVFIESAFSGDHNKFQHSNDIQTNSSTDIQTNSSNYHNCITNEVNKANNIYDENQVRNAVATWAVSHNITHNACNDLLYIFRQYTLYNLPVDIRTLLKTPRETDILRICGGEYFHSGLQEIIKKMLSKNDDTCINLILNIDGLPLAKSSRTSLWTILCSNTVNTAVYLVGAYFGYQKPTDYNIFLQPVVDDLINLINNGYIHDEKIIKIRLFALICDALAKSFALCIKSHTGYYSCTKCLIKGRYINGTICFPSDKTYPLRKDELFAVNAYKDFQINYSILNNVPEFLPLTNTPLDYMHLICLGVVKKMIILWMKGPFPVRLNTRSINKISHMLIIFRNTTPNDFVRRPRSINEVKHWKATEFRNFLLYTYKVLSY